ncbi:VOC family protein [Sphaerochaeta globosa]|uniref:Glyoxalase/bleomycin resistance protein/dioxygenase n=1 Tax=Sphaerochaeta globosa (strain ATCC BAA-1886 / DSM 22777 / Buddy) TaxID=158189 RepID=F0RWK4_SPHGB|nr:VOC family protein [Sphaerochaeta globosa]ADY13635.1 Glyoxalase/bleomycin resistance protein/dioxygenase [Sphaerochaeta globosa str. Buddy]
MHFVWATVTVADMEESLEFYQKVVGLPLVRRVKSNEFTELAFLGTSETQIELVHRSNAEPQPMGKGISLGFAVEDLEVMIQTVKDLGLELYEGPIAPNPHVRFFYVLDPNGLKIQFVERR